MQSGRNRPESVLLQALWKRQGRNGKEIPGGALWFQQGEDEGASLALYLLWFMCGMGAAVVDMRYFHVGS